MCVGGALSGTRDNPCAELCGGEGYTVRMTSTLKPMLCEKPERCSGSWVECGEHWRIDRLRLCRPPLWRRLWGGGIQSPISDGESQFTLPSKGDGTVWRLARFSSLSSKGRIGMVAFPMVDRLSCYWKLRRPDRGCPAQYSACNHHRVGLIPAIICQGREQANVCET